MEDNKDLNENVENTENTEETIVEIVDATENKEDTVEEVKNENDLENKDIDVTASGEIQSNPINISTLDDHSLNSSVNVDTTDFKLLYETTSKQLEAVNKEVEGLKKSKADLEEENTKLKSDIASLRENPFYNSTKGTADRRLSDINEFSVEDVKKMRNRI